MVRVFRGVLSLLPAVFILDVFFFFPGCLNRHQKLSPASQIHPMGLRTQLADVVLPGLQSGKRYSLKNLLHRSYQVTNTSEFMMKVSIFPDKPSAREVTSSVEPIPAVSWIKIEKDFVEMKPGETVESDIFITIPKARRWRGKRYLVMIESRTMAQTMVQIGLRSRLAFEVTRS